MYAFALGVDSRGDNLWTKWMSPSRNIDFQSCYPLKRLVSVFFLIFGFVNIFFLLFIRARIIIVIFVCKSRGTLPFLSHSHAQY